MIIIFIWLPLFIISILLFYVLWINGYLIKSRKTATLFVGSIRLKRRCKIRFRSCNGYIEKVIKIKEDRNYKFTFKSNITNGYVTAQIRDINDNILLQLDETNPESVIKLMKKNRYYLVLRFQHADGEIDLTWI